jgi:hypothetical protein
VIDSAGEIIREEMILTGPVSLADYFRRIPTSLVVIEVGMHSRWANHVLMECGHEVIVANPSKVKLIFGSDKKNDRVDARSLAQLTRVDRKLLFPVVHRSEHAHSALAVLRARDAVVRERTRLINTVRGLIKPTGVRIRVPSNAEVFPTMFATKFRRVCDLQQLCCLNKFRLSVTRSRYMTNTLITLSTRSLSRRSASSRCQASVR